MACMLEYAIKFFEIDSVSIQTVLYSLFSHLFPKHPHYALSNWNEAFLYRRYTAERLYSITYPEETATNKNPLFNPAYKFISKYILA